MSTLKYKLDKIKTYTTIYFVDTFVDSEVFMNNPAITSLPVKYSPDSTRSDFTKLIQSLPDINRIGFVFDTYRIKNKIFLEHEPYFTKGDLADNQTKFSRNFSLLKNLPDNIKLDFLCCNTLRNPDWVKYYAKLSPKIIGASGDETGNIRNNGNWKMENTGEDVKEIYFSPGISEYKNTLDISIFFDTTSANPCYLKKDCTLTDKDFARLNRLYDGKPSYFKVVKPINIKLSGQINITQPNQCIVIASHNVTICGNKKSSILVNVDAETFDGYYGLIMNGDLATNNQPYNNITISDITVDKMSSGLANLCGWITQLSFGFGAIHNKVTRCINYARLVENASGIVGFNSTCDITHCKNYGDMGTTCGGIIGFGINCNISNCVNYGNMIINNELGKSRFTGGICAKGLNTNFTKCVNKGSITSSGDNTDNIIGGICGQLLGKCKFIKCVNKGNIVASINQIFHMLVRAGLETTSCIGGICGQADGGLEFDECVNEGFISSDGFDKIGGIFGTMQSGGAQLTMCVNRGDIIANNASSIGGIVGLNDTSSGITLLKCFNKGTITSGNSREIGGICGIVSSTNITKCINIGDIISNDSSSSIAGICGRANDGCSIANSVNTGHVISDTTSGGNAGFVGGNSDTVFISNCYNLGKIKSAQPVNTNAAFIGGISSCTNMSLSNSYSINGPLVDIIPSENLLISSSGVSCHENRWHYREATKYLLDGWVKSDVKHKYWPIAP